jgi:hypothetical protein
MDEGLSLWEACGCLTLPDGTVITHYGMFWGEVNDYDLGRPSNRPDNLCQRVRKYTSTAFFQSLFNFL